MHTLIFCRLPARPPVLASKVHVYHACVWLQVKDAGYEIAHDGKCVTVFSAPNYCDNMGNKGAFITLKADVVPHFTQFDAAPHPDVKPMAYADMSLFGGLL
jgi:hypothetical protein